MKDRKDLHGAGHQLILDTALGFVVSGIVAFFVVKWLLRFVQSHTFNGFAIYRVLLGGGLLIGLYTHAVPDVSNEEAKPAPTPLVAPVPEATTPSKSAAPSSDTNAAPMTTNTPASMATNAELAPIPPGTAAEQTNAPATNAMPSAPATNAAPGK
jgi:hypothetical protein